MFGRSSDDNAGTNDQTHLAPSADAAATSAPTVDPAPVPSANGALNLPEVSEAAAVTNAAPETVISPSSAAPASSELPGEYILTDGPGAPAATASTPVTDIPVNDVTEVPADPTPAADPVPDNSSPDPSLDPAPDPAPSPAPAAPVSNDVPGDLSSIKQQALQQLSPLVGHLELAPEEKFRTTMMMLQATDDQDMIKDAYAAAQAIPDEKTRAQALLDVVNEINYFTQQANSQNS